MEVTAAALRHRDGECVEVTWDYELRTSLDLEPGEARALAAELTKAADKIDSERAAQR
jgi:hypothetical protein